MKTEKQVLVFRTSVNHHREVEQLRPVLDQLFTETEKWNFDLEDCDRILRVETGKLPAETIQGVLQQEGFACAELEG